MSSYYKKRNYCIIESAVCGGFTCEAFRNSECRGVLWSIKDDEGNIIASIPPIRDSDAGYQEVIMDTLEQLHFNGYILKEEVIEILKTKYEISITPRVLKYYGTEKLITPGLVKRIAGIRGSVSIYKDETPELIYFLKYLQSMHNLSLNDISKYYKLLRIEDIDTLEKHRNYEMKFIKREKGGPLVRLGKLFNEVATFQKIAILRSLYEIDSIEYKDPHLSPGITVDVERAGEGEYSITVDLTKRYGKKVIYSKDGVKIK